MELPPSRFPNRLTTAYWAEVRELLQTNHRLTSSAASKAVRIYLATMAKEGVGDILYHSSTEDMAAGIFTGKYAEQEEVRPARPKVVKLPKWVAKKATVKKAAAAKKPSKTFRAAYPSVSKPAAKKTTLKTTS